MSKPQKVREVYAELKDALDDEHSSSDVLECAALIVELADERTRGPRCGTSDGRTPFVELPLDVLYSNWGWRLVCQELKSEDDYVVRQKPEDLIDQLCRIAA
jgi:hypothetical protein